MKKILLIVSAVIFGYGFANSQAADEYLHCGQYDYVQRLIQQGFDPDHDLRIQYLEEFTRNFDPANAAGSYTRGSQTIYVIPIVFHVIHMNGPENISDAQIYDELVILNKDFNKMNADTSMVVATFSNNIANIGFEFRLAQKDALGNCTKGITRTYSINTNGGGNSAVDDVNRNLNGSPTNTQAIRFPRNMYLNVWICNDLGDAAGYTNNPNGWTPAKYDGIWMQHSYVGSIGTSAAYKSRALTHEVGHWFNLSHTWGNTNNPGCTGQAGAPCNGANNCNSDDGVSDTPNTIGWTTCNLSGKTCTADPSPVDNVQNFMEYSYCSRMYTEGQKTRMLAAANSSTGERNELWIPSNLIATGVDVPAILCAADFTTDRIVICEGETVDFTDMSYNGVTGWNWAFTGGTPSIDTLQNPSVTYNTAGTYSVSLTADNGSSNVSLTRNAYITVIPAIGSAVPLIESFENTTSLPDNEWFVYNPNGYGWDVTSATAYSGSKCLKLNASQINSGHDDAFISTTYDLSALPSVVVTFKYAFAQKNTSNDDVLRVYISNDCGETWSLRKQIASSVLSTVPAQSSAFTPSSQAQWEESQITTISASYLTANFRIKFEFVAGGGNNVYIDDINISTALGIEDFTFDFALSAYPNPFETGTVVSFNLDNQKDVELVVYDVIGKQVMNLVNGNLSQGKHTYSIDGNKLKSGIYYVKLRAGNQEKVLKIINQ